MELAAALEASMLGEAMRRSPLLYPAANVGHILAMLVFFATVSVMDLRLLGALRAVPWQSVVRWGRPIAATALAVQALTGVMLLAPDASALVGNPAFRAKLALIVVGLANVLALEVLLGRDRRRNAMAAPPIPSGARFCAAVSIGAWLATAALGRLIAYV